MTDERERQSPIRSPLYHLGDVLTAFGIAVPVVAFRMDSGQDWLAASMIGLVGAARVHMRSIGDHGWSFMTTT